MYRNAHHTWRAGRARKLWRTVGLLLLGQLAIAGAGNAVRAEAADDTNGPRGTTTNAFGEADYVLVFDGLDDVVDVLTTDALRMSNPDSWSIGFWTKLERLNDPEPHLMGIRGGCGGGTFFQVISRSWLNSIDGGGSGVCGLAINDRPHFEAPTHYSWSFSADSTWAYMNGELIGSAPCGPHSPPGGDLLLGSSGSCPHYMTGWLDELWIRDRALSREEMAETWNCQISPDDPSLVGYWSFNEPIGTQEVYDLSGYGHDGVLGRTTDVESSDPHRVVSPLALCDSPPRLVVDIGLDPIGDCGLTESLAGWTIVATPLDAEGGEQVAESSGTDGSVVIGLVPGTWQVVAQAPANWDVTCNPGPHVVEVAMGEIEYLELGGRPIDGVQDLEVHIASTPDPRPGFQYTYTATYANTGSDPADADVEIEFPASTSFVSASAEATLDGNVVSWSFPSLAPGEGGRVSVTVELDQTVSIRTVVNAEARALPTTGDFDPEDNVDHETAEVVGSFDPNDKRVSPEGYLEPEGTLTYRLRFQNVGTASAINVTVRDTLDTMLDLATLVPTGASHPYTLTFDGRELVWDFVGIELPDSTSDEPSSHGFVEFEIQPIDGIAPGSIIQNRGGIYFDFNPVVLTNTVSNEILGPASLDPSELEPDGDLIFGQVVPSPTRGGASFQLGLLRSGELDVGMYTVDGRRIRSLAHGLRTAGNVEVSWNGLDSNGREVAAGIYFVRGRLTSEGRTSTAKVQLVVLE